METAICEPYGVEEIQDARSVFIAVAIALDRELATEKEILHVWHSDDENKMEIIGQLSMRQYADQERGYIQ